MKNKEIDKENEKTMQITKKILDNVFHILNLLSPIIDKIKMSEELQEFYQNGTIKKVAFLFGEISEQSKKIADYNLSNLSEEFLENLDN